MKELSRGVDLYEIFQENEKEEKENKTNGRGRGLSKENEGELLQCLDALGNKEGKERCD